MRKRNDERRLAKGMVGQSGTAGGLQEAEKDKGGMGREVQGELIILTVSYSFAHEALKAVVAEDLHQLTSGNISSLGAWQSQAKEDKKKAEEEN